MTRRVVARASLGLLATAVLVLAMTSVGVASAATQPPPGGGGAPGGTYQTVCFNSYTQAAPYFTMSGTVLPAPLPTLIVTTMGSSCNGNAIVSVTAPTAYSIWTYHGAASYNGYYSLSANSTFKYSQSTSSSASYAVNMTFANWVAQSDSPNGCWDNDNANGAVSFLVTTSLFESSNLLAGPVTYDFPAGPLASCNDGSNGAPSYSTGGTFYTSEPYQVGIGIASLSLTKGQTYTVQVVLECLLQGSAWGPNMSTDTWTESSTECGPQPNDGNALFNSVTVYS